MSKGSSMSKGKRIREGRKQMPNQFPPNAKKSIMEALKQAGEKKRQAAEAEQESSAFKIRKPDTQNIGDKIIQWSWQSELVSLFASYCRAIPNVQDRAIGDYWVDWEFDNSENKEVSSDLNTNEVKLFAELLMSAHRWAEIWPQHMGEFFVAGQGAHLQAVPEPQTPELIKFIEEEDSDE